MDSLIWVLVHYRVAGEVRRVRMEVDLVRDLRDQPGIRRVTAIGDRKVQIARWGAR